MGSSVSSKHATWFSILRAAVQHTGEDAVSEREWIDGLVSVMATLGIEWVPGCHRKRITTQQIVFLVGTKAFRQVVAARPGHTAISIQQGMAKWYQNLLDNF